MAVTTSGLGSAARRHYRCAVHLASGKEEAEGCYLIGLAAECAIKMHLLKVGFSLIARKRKAKKESNPKRKELVYTHFPELATQLLAQGEGIVAGRILAKVGSPAFMDGWDVRMRYQDQKSTPNTAKKFGSWRLQVDELFSELGI